VKPETPLQYPLTIFANPSPAPVAVAQVLGMQELAAEFNGAEAPQKQLFAAAIALDCSGDMENLGMAPSGAPLVLVPVGACRPTRAAGGAPMAPIPGIPFPAPPLGKRPVMLQLLACMGC
jgi:hypothetical protein